MAEWSLALFSYYESGLPKSPARAAQVLGPWHITAEQQTAFDSLAEGTYSLCRLRVSEPLTRGRKSLYESLTYLARLNSRPGQEVRPQDVSAKTVDVTRLSLPKKAAVLDPRDVLRGRQKYQYDNIDKLPLPPEEWPEPLPKACLMIPASEEQALRRLLFESGMVELVPETEIPVTPAGKKILAGIFCVDHKIGSDRLIFDRRPVNATEARFKWCELPHGSMMCQLRVGPGEHVRGTVRDLSKYFYQLRGPPGWSARNAFGRLVTGAEAKELGGSEHGRYHLGLLTWAMGGHNSVCVAQQVHEELTRDTQAFPEYEWMKFGRPSPVSKNWHGIYIDDLLLLAVVPQRDLHKPNAASDTSKLEAALQGYQDHALPVAEAKGVTRQKCFTAWGTEVDSPSGMCGTARERRLQLVHVLFGALLTPCWTRKTTESILGSLVHPFMHRRELLSILGRTHRWASSLSEHTTHRVPADILDELRGSMIGLFFAATNIRAPVVPQIFASDATPAAAGVTAARVSREFAESLFEFAEHRGQYVRLDRSPLEIAFEKWDSPHLPDLCREAVAAAPWRVIKQCMFKQTAHVNLQEARALRFVLRSDMLKGVGPRRIINLTDSRVLLGAYGKGRSSAGRLNSILRSMMGYSIMRNIFLKNCWIGTAENVADDPSRDEPLRDPVVPSSEAVRRLITPEGDPDISSAARSRSRRRTCLEVFGGKVGLSKSLISLGLAVSEPIEAFPQKGTYRAECDLTRPQVFRGLLEQVLSGCFVYIHFGVPCKSWSAWQRLNPNSTRTSECPGGTAPSPAEAEGNLLATLVARLCLAQAVTGFLVN